MKRSFELKVKSYESCVILASRGREAVGFQSFRLRVFKIMGDRRFYKIECLHMLRTPESEWLKVTALNLFHPTAPAPLQKVGFFLLRHSLLRGG